MQATTNPFGYTRLTNGRSRHAQYCLAVFFSATCLAACALEQVHHSYSSVKVASALFTVQLLFLGLIGLPEPSKMTSQPSPPVPTTEDTPLFTRSSWCGLTASWQRAEARPPTLLTTAASLPGRVETGLTGLVATALVKDSKLTGMCLITRYP